jgi:hypothetical protein
MKNIFKYILIIVSYFYLDSLQSFASTSLLNDPEVKLNLSSQNLIQDLDKCITLSETQGFYFKNLIKTISEDPESIKDILLDLQAYHESSLPQIPEIKNPHLYSAARITTDFQMSSIFSDYLSLSLKELKNYILHAEKVDPSKIQEYLGNIHTQLCITADMSCADIGNLSRTEMSIIEPNFSFIQYNTKSNLSTINYAWNGAQDQENLTRFYNIVKIYNILGCENRVTVDTPEFWDLFNSLFRKSPFMSIVMNEFLTLRKIEKLIEPHLEKISKRSQIIRPQSIGDGGDIIDVIYKEISKKALKLPTFSNNSSLQRLQKLYIKKTQDKNVEDFLFTQDETLKLLSSIVRKLPLLEVDNSFLSPHLLKFLKNKNSQEQQKKKKRSKKKNSLPSKDNLSLSSKEPSIVIVESIPEQPSLPLEEKNIPSLPSLEMPEIEENTVLPSKFLEETTSLIIQEIEEDNDETIFDWDKWYEEYIKPFQTPQIQKEDQHEDSSPSLPSLSGKAETFYNVIFGQGYSSVKQRDFNAFLKAIGGYKLKMTTQGYQPTTLTDKSVEIFYAVPNLTRTHKEQPFMIFKVHQPHSAGTPFPRKTLYNFFKRDLETAGYGFKN